MYGRFIWRDYRILGRMYEGYWMGRFESEVEGKGKLKRKVRCGDWVLGYVAMGLGRCFRCMGNRTRYDEFYGLRVCFDCRKSYSGFKLITKTRAKNEYKLKDNDLDELERVEVDNPHYKTGSKMVLYLETDVKIRSGKK